MSRTKGGRKRTMTNLELRRKQYDSTPKPPWEGSTKRPGSHKK